MRARLRFTSLLVLAVLALSGCNSDSGNSDLGTNGSSADHSANDTSDESLASLGSAINRTQVVQGSIEGQDFVFVSGSYEEDSEGYSITLYPAEPLPESERLWSPYETNLDMVLIPLPLGVGSYKLPYKLNPSSTSVTTPTIFEAEDQSNLMTTDGVVEIYSVDDVNGVITGGLHVVDLHDNELNGTFTVRKLGTF